MSPAVATLLFALLMVAALVATYRPLGDYLARVFTATRHLRAERVIYRIGGIDPDSEQPWPVYLRGVLAFSLVSCLFLYAFLRLQHYLFLSLGFPGMAPDLSFNTAASFVTNTNWQAYSGESAAGYLVQMAGLAVQNFVSAAVGISVAIALVRGFARKNTDRLGNFWVDLTRASIRVLLPISFVMAIVFVAGGMIENFHAFHTITTLTGAKQSIPGGPVASQEAIKELGTNGGGFFNANAAHPFENPTSWTNWLEVYLILAIAFSLPRAFGVMVGDKRQGRLIACVMAGLAIVSVTLTVTFQLVHHGTVPTAVNSAAEGTETRFGAGQSAAYATATTLTSTGAVDSFHDSYTSFGGMMTILNMGLGEIAPGGVGSGLYGMLVLAVLTVFIAGLMIGRTPEYLGKKLSGREIKFASLYILATPACVLLGTAASLALSGPRNSILNPGAHGLSEVLYAYMSGANNNGSAFAGLSVNTTWYNTTIGLAMLIARFLPMVFILAMAGSLAQQRPVPESAGTLPTYRPQFAGMLTGVALIIVLLTYLPATALGPLAEGLH